MLDEKIHGYEIHKITKDVKSIFFQLNRPNQPKDTNEKTTWHKRSKESRKAYAATAKSPSINNKILTIPCREWERPFQGISKAIHHRKSPIDIFFQIIERRICVRVFARSSRLYSLTYPSQCVSLDV